VAKRALTHCLKLPTALHAPTRCLPFRTARRAQLKSKIIARSAQRAQIRCSSTQDA
jgi:hypothetical protein